MRNKLVSLAAAATLALALPMASATVLDFDDLKGSPTDMPEVYGGLDWFGWQYYNTDQGNQPYTPASGETRLLTALGDGNSISSASAFTFQGAAFTGQALTTGGKQQDLQFELYRGADMVHSSDTFHVSDTPTFVASGYDGAVDRVVVLNNGQQRFVMDNLSFNEVALPSPVPEPHTWLMSIAGLAALGFMRRRRAPTMA